MKSFKIEVIETSPKVIEVDAENVEDAVIKVREMYQKEEVVLDSDDYVTTEIEECEK